MSMILPKEHQGFQRSHRVIKKLLMQLKDCPETSFK
jgi:hypothetical protein